MNQYQNRNPEEQKTFLSKIKDNYSSKFANLSLTSAIQKGSSYVDKDGDSETETLIHKAFVKYFDSQNEPYPDWLGVPREKQNQRYAQLLLQYDSSTSAYRPVYANYNSQPQVNHQQPILPTQHEERPSMTPQLLYQRRSSSRLQDLYNKSRLQSVPGSGYNTQMTTAKTSSTSGNRLRERMMSGQGGATPGTKATWGKH